jgi:hypothetical protein
MCAENPTTKEHVPPKTFFPTGYRKNLWTVPSCSIHNNDNSLDVEYTGNCIINALESTGSALEQSQIKVFKAFDRRASVRLGTLENPKLIRLPSGELTVTFRVNTDRVTSVMEAIAFGVHFNLSGTTYMGRWKIVTPNLRSVANAHYGQPEERVPLFNNLADMSFDELETPEPDVFRCSVHTFPDESVVYKFVFYIGFTVYAIDTFIHEIITS